MIDLDSEICKLVLKLDFTALGIMELLSNVVRHEQGDLRCRVLETESILSVP